MRILNKEHKIISAISLMCVVAIIASMGIVTSAIKKDTVNVGTYEGLTGGTVTVDGKKYWAGSRDPFLWPYASDSIWNTPIGSGAQFTDPVFTGNIGWQTEAGGNTEGDGKYLIIYDEEFIHETTESDPVYDIYSTTQSLDWQWPANNDIKNENYLGTSGNKRAYLGKTYWPVSAGITSYYGPRSIRYKSNGSTIAGDKYTIIYDEVAKTGNNCGAILQPDGRSVIQFQPLYRHTTDSNVKFITGTPKMVDDIYGDGIQGSHSGSGLSTLGGSLRVGEIEAGVIRHAIKMNVWAEQWLYYNGDESNFGYRWPATNADSVDNANSNDYNYYNGSNPELVMGSLLSLTEEDYNALKGTFKNEFSEILLDAYYNYGAYIVDNTGSERWTICGSEEARDKIFCKYGVNLDNFQNGYNNAITQETKDYMDDFLQIVKKLRVVTNNTEHNIGGGGTPRQPLAPEIGAVDGISLDETIDMVVGGKKKLEVTLYPTNVSNVDIEYKSNNTTIATIDKNGKITAKSAGSTTVTATLNGITASCTVNVITADTNGDGRVNSADYIYLKQFVDGHKSVTIFNKKKLDVNGDGTVDSTDIATLKRYITGLEEVNVIEKGAFSLTQVSNIEAGSDAKGIRSLVRDGNYIYTVTNYQGKSYVRKYDVTGATAPKATKIFERPNLQVPNHYFNWLAVKGDYIYILSRNPAAGYSNPIYTNGKLIVVNKNTLEVARNAKFDFPNGSNTSYAADAGTDYKWTDNSFAADTRDRNSPEKQECTFTIENGECNLNMKGSQIIVHKNILIVNLQLRGWCAFEIDKSDGTHLTLKSTIMWGEVDRNVYEHHGGKVFELNGRTYYMAVGFAEGTVCYDITDISNPQVVWDFTKEGKDRTERLAVQAAIQEHFPNKTINLGIQFFNVVIDYPYAYFTVNSGTTGFRTENAYEGILTYDISDIVNGKVELIGMDFLPEDHHIDYRESDVPPTTIAKVGNFLFVGAFEEGLGVFKINADGIAKFYKMQSPADLGYDVTGEGVGFDNVFALDNEIYFINIGGIKYKPGTSTKEDTADAEISNTVPRIFVYELKADHSAD